MSQMKHSNESHVYSTANLFQSVDFLNESNLIKSL